MKLFVKAALFSAMVTSTGVMAAQLKALDDSVLSDTTGQDGITITVTTPDAIKINQLYLHDNDGLATDAGTGGTEKAGAIKIGTLATGTDNQKANGITLTQTSNDPLLKLVIDSDAGANGTTPFLNIGTTIGAMKAEIGTISVAASGTTGADSIRRGGTNDAVILEGLSLSIGSTSANIQLGNTPQGAMIKLKSSIGDGLTVENLALKDSSKDGGGVLAFSKMQVTSGGEKNLNVDSNVNITTDGLVLKTNNPAETYDMYITDLALGTKDKSIGDVEIQGLSLGNTTISVTGH